MNNINKVELRGIVKAIRPSHTFNGINYSMVDLEVKCANSPVVSQLKLMAKENFAPQIRVGEPLHIMGTAKTSNKPYYEEPPYQGAKSLLYVFIESILDDLNADCNLVEITGTILRTPETYTVTKTKAKLSRAVLVNKATEKSISYVHLIAWEGLADQLASYNTDAEIHIVGRLQHRTFTSSKTGNKIIEREVCVDKILSE